MHCIQEPRARIQVQEQNTLLQELHSRDGNLQQGGVLVVDPNLQSVAVQNAAPCHGFQHPHTGSAAAHNGHGNGIAVAFGVKW